MNNIPEYKVSEFNHLIKEVIESNFNYVRIKGEISEIKTATRGQLYLTLKDDDSILSGVIWNTKKKYLQFHPEQGMEVIVTGKVTTWSKYKTTYQIDIDTIELAGEGALLKLIENRKKKLHAQGIFDINHKKNIPYLPEKIGVITSPTGSVIYDIINRIKDRFPTNIDIWPVSVQGANAVETIIDAIKGFHLENYEIKPDVIIIARGGGSTEDLMAFNDENLALAVYQATIPIVTAIGHETDTTIIDYVSDLRVSTPTAAAEKVVPMKIDLDNSINNLLQRLDYRIQNDLNNYKDHLSNLSKFVKDPNYIVNIFKEKIYSVVENLKREIDQIFAKKLLILNNYTKLLSSPEKILILKKVELKNISINLEKNIQNEIKIEKNELNKQIRLLNSNSINTVLKKGFTIISKSKKIIKNPSNINNQDKINIKFHKESINLEIKKI